MQNEILLSVLMQLLGSMQPEQQPDFDYGTAISKLKPGENFAESILEDQRLDSGGHMLGVDQSTGVVLKNANHPTID